MVLRRFAVRRSTKQTSAVHSFSVRYYLPYVDIEFRQTIEFNPDHTTEHMYRRIAELFSLELGEFQLIQTNGNENDKRVLILRSTSTPVSELFHQKGSKSPGTLEVELIISPAQANVPNEKAASSGSMSLHQREKNDGIVPHGVNLRYPTMSATGRSSGNRSSSSSSSNDTMSSSGNQENPSESEGPSCDLETRKIKPDASLQSESNQFSRPSESDGTTNSIWWSAFLSTTAESFGRTTETLVNLERDVQNHHHKMLICAACMDEFAENEVMFFFCSIDPNVMKSVLSSTIDVARSPPAPVDPPANAVCFECAAIYIKTNKNNLPIRCFTQECKHELLPEEIALALGRGNMTSGFKSSLYLEIDELQRDHAIVAHPQDYASCPSAKCTWIVARSTKGAMEKVTCPTCHATFCSNCNDIYHYRTTCFELQEMKRERQNWILHGRSKYWEKSQDESRLQALAASKAERERVGRVKQIEYADESYKATRCRHCPHCGRLVERIGGCELMLCGEDSHGGNTQPGCRRSFSWNAARPYRPVELGRNVKYQAPPVEQSDKYHHVHEICDRCGTTEVRGLLFECLNCPCYRVCEQCEIDIEKNHINGHSFGVKQRHPSRKKRKEKNR
ncbi:hypothetical protein ACA910_013933 [Epithemia clementina (nom. ined.)]